MSQLNYATGRVTRLVGFVVAVYRELRESNVPFMAGSIAYSAFISLFPLLLLAVLAASVVGGEAFAQYIVGLTESYLSPSGQQVVVDSLTRANQRAEVSVFTLLVFVWATLRVFRGLDIAISILYGTAGHDGLIEQFIDGALVLTALGVATIGTVGLLIVTAGLPELVPIPFLDVLLLVVFLTVVFLPVYYIFPDVDLAIGEVLPGAIVAAIGWATLQQAFQVYVMFSEKAELYGIIGGVLLLITWLYFGALIVLLGATVNVVVRGRSSVSTGTAESHVGQQ